MDSSSVNDYVILELIDKITQIEEKVNGIQNIEIPMDNTDSTELNCRINSLTETVNTLKSKVETIYKKGYTEVSFQSLFDVDAPQQNNDIA